MHSGGYFLIEFCKLICWENLFFGWYDFRWQGLYRGLGRFLRWGLFDWTLVFWQGLYLLKKLDIFLYLGKITRPFKGVFFDVGFE